MKSNNFYGKLAKTAFATLASALAMCAISTTSFADDASLATHAPNSCTLAEMSAVKVKTFDSSSVTLQWSAVNGVKKYEVAFTDDMNKKVLEKCDTTSETTYTFKNLKPGTMYRFLVDGYDDTDSNNIKYTKGSKGYMLYTALEDINNFKIDKSEKDSVSVKWDAVTGADSYEVYVKKNNKYEKLETIKTTTYTFKNLNSETVYDFAVSPAKTVKFNNKDNILRSISYATLKVTPGSTPVSDTTNNTSTAKPENADSTATTTVAPQSTENTVSGQKDNSPKTGDNNPLILVIVLGSLSMITCVSTFLAKRKKD